MSYKRQGSPIGPGGVTTVAFKRPRASDHFESQAASTALPDPGHPPPLPPCPTPPTGPAASRGSVAGGGIPKGRRQGVCTHWDLKKAYGFLQDHANGADSKRVFCHNSSLAWAGDGKQEFASLAIGDEVEFEYIDGERGVEAVKVTATVQYSERRRGTVTAFNDEKGYGFAADAEPASVGNKEVLVHHKKMKSNARHKTLVVGELIEYGLVSTAKGFAAIDIVQLDPPQISASSTPRVPAPMALVASTSAAPPDFDYSAYGYQLGQDGQWYPTSAATTTAEVYYATYGVYPGQSYPQQASGPTVPPSAPAPRPLTLEQRPPPAVPAVRPRDGPPPVRRPFEQASPHPPPSQQAHPPPPPQHAPPPPPPSQYETQHSPAPYPESSHSAPLPPQRQTWPQEPPHTSPPMNSDVSWGSRKLAPAQLQQPQYEREPSYSQPAPYNPPATHDQSRPSYERNSYAHLQQQKQYGQPASSHGHYRGYGEAGDCPPPARGGAGPPPDAWGVPSSGWGDIRGRPMGAYEAPVPTGAAYGQPPPMGGQSEAPWVTAGGSQVAPSRGRGMGPFAGAGPVEVSILYEGRRVRGGAGEGPFAAYTNSW